MSKTPKNMNDLSNLVDHWMKAPGTAFSMSLENHGSNGFSIKVGSFSQCGRGATPQEALENLFEEMPGMHTLMSRVRTSKESEIRECQLALDKAKADLTKLEEKLGHHREVLAEMNTGNVLPRKRM